MTSQRFRRFRPEPGDDERGVALMLAIAFLVCIAAITGALLPAVTSGLKDRTILDTVRNRQYAADAGVEDSVALVRSRIQGGSAQNPCGTALPNVTLNAVTVQVVCSYLPGLTLSGYLQRNITFSACLIGLSCSAANSIVQAQVNYQSTATFAASSATITRTWVQSWSVNQ